jgi:peptide/nickel transport system permease protein
VTFYFVRRCLLVVPMMVGISLLLFVVIHLPPGGPEDVYLAGSSTMSSADAATIRTQLGLDDPLALQYLKWLNGTVQGDWGRSFKDGRPAREVVFERLPASVELGSTAVVAAVLVAVPSGIAMAARRSVAERFAMSLLTVLGMSAPPFWLALMLIVWLSVRLGLIPTGGTATIGAPWSLTDALQHLVGPALVVSVSYIAAWSRYVRSSVLEVLREDYVRTARAKGLPERVVLFRHCLRNSLLPLITMLGAQLPQVLSTMVAVEVVFSWPGLGRLLVTSLLGRDYPVLMGAFLLLALLVILGNLFADMAYAVVDPRIRYTADA